MSNTKTVKQTEPAYEISSEEMLDLPIYGYDPNKHVNFDWHVQPSAGGNTAEINYRILSHGIAAARRVLEAYVARVYPTGIDKVNALKLSEGELQAFNVLSNDKDLRQHYGLNDIRALARDLERLHLYVGQLELFGSVLVKLQR